jgi:hypothetical protein
MMRGIEARLLQLPVGTRVIVTAHRLTGEPLAEPILATHPPTPHPVAAHEARLLQLRVDSVGTRVIVTAHPLGAHRAPTAAEHSFTEHPLAAHTPATHPLAAAGAGGDGEVTGTPMKEATETEPIKLGPMRLTRERDEHVCDCETRRDGLLTGRVCGALQGATEAAAAEAHKPGGSQSELRELTHAGDVSAVEARCEERAAEAPATAKVFNEQSDLALEVSAVEIWCRELPTSWGTEIFRVYELRRPGDGGTEGGAPEDGG